MISSPERTFSWPHVAATRLMASVVPRVQMISERSGALMNRARTDRAPSKRSVARRERS
jgi:hypothetical protein